MNLLEMSVANKFKKTGATKKLSVPGEMNNQYDVYAIPLEYLYYNNQNGRINTTYKQYQAEHGLLTPEAGNSEYNKMFEKFIYNSNKKALDETLRSIKEKTQQEPGAVLPDGRIIDGNRRYTALRMLQSELGICQTFEAVILPLDANLKTDEKTIKELELDLQLGREERVNYDPIDRIFDVFSTIKVEKLMTIDEYKKASGVGNARGINRDIRLAELIIKFIKIVSPGGNPVDKFYLARDLKLDGPIEEIESTLNKIKSSKKEAITDAVLVRLIVSKAGKDNNDKSESAPTTAMRELKNEILKNPDILEHYLDAVDEKVDTVIDTFKESPIKTSNDIKKLVSEDDTLRRAVERIKNSTDRLIYKGKNDSKRKQVLNDLEDVRDKLEEIGVDDFKELKVEENLDAKDALKDITDIIFRLRKGLNL